MWYATLLLLTCAGAGVVSARYGHLQTSAMTTAGPEPWRWGADALRRLQATGTSGNCTPPRTVADTKKPFCFVPDTVSPQAKQFLSTTSAGTYSAGNPDDPSKARAFVEQARQFFANVSSAGSQAAVQQYLQGTRNDTVGGVPVVFGIPKGVKQNAAPSDTKVLLYIHGGGYSIGSCHYQWSTVAATAAAGGLTVLCVEYRLAPEHPFPAGLNDVLSVYKALVQQQGYNPKNIVLLGDSAGGGMVPAVAIELKREGVPLPAALGMFSPWSDVQARVDTMETLVGVDPVIASYDTLAALGAAYVGGYAALYDNPLASPLRADYVSIFSGGSLPPTLIQVGLRELLLSDAVLLYHKMKAAAPNPARVVISPYDGMWHVFQSFPVPEAEEASREMADYFTRAIKGSVC